ncbi:MAG: hypothetical protein VKK03_00905 [Synechococcus sp.]|nr:hypothetical protein [Synechococcus sp.]
MRRSSFLAINPLALLLALMAGMDMLPLPEAMARSDVAPGLELECKTSGGPWRPCRMEIEQIGRAWWIDVADQRIRFEHDGSGQVRMQPQAGGAWVTVPSSWAGHQQLCWGSVCARGSIPLD